MKLLINIVLYTFSVFSLLLSIGGLGCKEYGMSIFFFVLGLSLIPTIRNKLNNLLTIFIESKLYNNKNVNHIFVRFFTGFLKFTFFIVLLSVIVLLAPESNTINNPDLPVKIVSTTKPTKSRFRGNKNTKLIAKSTGLHKDVAGKIYEQLISCGIGNINSFDYYAKINNNIYAYTIQASEIPEKLLIYFDSDGNVLELYYDTNLHFPIIKNRKRIAVVKDFYLTFSQQIDLEVQAKGIVRRCLKAPSTAKFPSINYSILPDKTIVISGIVEAQNSFGVPLQTPFILKFKRNGDDYNCISFEFDGEKIFVN